MATYSVHLLTWESGTVLTDQGAFTTLARDSLGSPSFVRNGMGDFSFTFSIWDELAYSYLGIDQVMGRGEIQVLRDATVIWQGVPVAFDASLAAGTFTIHCRTIEQYFAWLLFGKAERENELTNGDFEANGAALDDWTTTGTTATVETVNINQGIRAAKLDGLGHISQTVSGITHSYDPGLAYRMAAYVQMSAATAFTVGDDFIIARLIANNGTREYIETITVGDVDRFDAYTRVSQDILLAADDTWSVEIRLEGNGGGDIFWDDVLFTRNEAVTVAYPGEDLTTLVQNIVSHAQDTGFGKKNLNITVDATTTTIELIKGYAFSDHENIWDALQDLTREFDCDIWADLDRVVHVAPKRGSAVAGMDRDIAVTNSSPTREADFRALTDFADVSFTCDTSQQRSTIIVGAEGPDFAREEAGASTTGWGFGPYVVSEEYMVAPASTKVRDLQPYADSQLARKSRQAVFPSITYPWADAGAAEPGDTCAVVVDVGCVFVDETYRIETWAVNMVTDTVQCTFDLDL